MKEYETEGWIVMRTAGSHGKWDVIALFHTGGGILVHLVQCKVVKNEVGIKREIAKFKKEAPFPAYIEGDVDQILRVKVTGAKGDHMYRLE
jgi:hypothetical protein